MSAALDWSPWFDRLRDAVDGLTDKPILTAEVIVPYRLGVSIALLGLLFMTRWGPFEVEGGRRDGDEWIAEVRAARYRRHA
jgi:hypothetical protein